jgi:flagellar biosynthesis protein FlhF
MTPEAIHREAIHGNLPRGAHERRVAIHRVRGRSLRDALERARAVHGARALVLGQETGANGEVVLLVDGSRPPSLLELEQRLEDSGTSPELSADIVATARRSALEGISPIDAAADAIARRFRIAASPRAGGGTKVIAFVGPTGAGKTTSLAKLATRLVRVGRRVALVSIDSYRTGALSQIEAYADKLAIECAFARDGRELAQVVAHSRRCDAVLVDTAGRSPRDGAELAEMASALETAGSRARQFTLLVLPASASPSALEGAVRAFAVAKPDGCVVTKLDETRAVAPALELAAHAGVGLSFLCDGQDVAQHFHRASGERCADLFLRGRLP